MDTDVHEREDSTHRNAESARLAGARRAAGFEEPQEDMPATPGSELRPPDSWERFATSPPPVAASTGSWSVTAPPRPEPAQWGAKRHWVRLLSLGLAKAKAGPAELAHRQAEDLIRSASWPRAVRVAVVNPKGGVGKTPAAIIIAGIIAQLRGGGVVVWDAGDSAGSLAMRAEGIQQACVSDVAAHPDHFANPGTIAAAVTRQTSFAAVMGSKRQRQLDDQAVHRIMTTLDQSFPISIADTGNVPHSPAFRFAVGYSDAIVIPTPATRDAIDRALEVLDMLQSSPLAHLAARATVVINRGLGAQGDLADQAREVFTQRGAGVVFDVPFDRAIAANGVLRPRDLSHASQIAWTQVAASVVSSIVINQS